MDSKTMGRNEQAFHYFLVGSAYLVYSLAVIYGDLMFLQIVSQMFSQDPLLHALAFGGAVMTAASAILLPVAKIRWLMPGTQMIAGWLFWGAEVLLLVLNAMLAYTLASGTSTEILSLWRVFAPATPLVAVIGWGACFMLDPRNQMRHAMFEGFADQVSRYSDTMRQVNNSNEIQNIIKERALYWTQVMADQTIPRMMGIPEEVIRKGYATLHNPTQATPFAPSFTSPLREQGEPGDRAGGGKLPTSNALYPAHQPPKAQAEGSAPIAVVERVNGNDPNA